MARFTPANAVEMGQKGGLSTFKRHGRAFMQKIGRLGFQATVDRHFDGDRQAAGLHLSRRGLMAMDPHPENQGWTPPSRVPELIKRSPDAPRRLLRYRRRTS